MAYYVSIIFMNNIACFLQKCLDFYSAYYILDVFAGKFQLDSIFRRAFYTKSIDQNLLWVIHNWKVLLSWENIFKELDHLFVKW